MGQIKARTQVRNTESKPHFLFPSRHLLRSFFLQRIGENGEFEPSRDALQIESDTRRRPRSIFTMTIRVQPCTTTLDRWAQRAYGACAWTALAHHTDLKSSQSSTSVSSVPADSWDPTPIISVCPSLRYISKSKRAWDCVWDDQCIWISPDTPRPVQTDSANYDSVKVQFISH